eukprot:7263862-Ditylum_brightwellii.AAC.1
MFEEWQRGDKTFMTKWLYVIDRGWQQFVVKAKEGKIDLSTMCFRRFQEDFECGVCWVRLHQVLTKLIKSRRKRPGDGTGGESTQNDGHQFKRKRGDTIKNTKPNPAWFIKENENYDGLLHNGMYKGKVKLLMWGNKRQSCAKWHHVGECTDTCNRAYSRCTEIPKKARKDLDHFIRECRKFRDTGSKD